MDFGISRQAEIAEYPRPSPQRRAFVSHVVQTKPSLSHSRLNTLPFIFRYAQYIRRIRQTHHSNGQSRLNRCAERRVSLANEYAPPVG